LGGGVLSQDYLISFGGLKMIEEEKKRAKNEPIVTKPDTTSDIQDIDLGFVEKKKFRIAGDYNRMLELNVSDMNIYSRFTQAYPKLQEFAKEASEKLDRIDTESDDSLSKIAEFLDEIDAKMREQIDFIFDTNASEVCAPSGNMFDPINGEFRYEHIIGTLAKLYTTGFESEIDKFKKRTSKHTSKYTKKYHN
jgi:hypothetical protein